eukprot:TRINITY_DN2403_c0_g1_i1.p1 TRINITY_DN2403_c0_g1~~TRINITY_DN2403_c0_g1_i1.p1  ORF type:complete len:106 (+),score=30.27 TRINITY_DN2403_c0_g1_i1:264-581(+)
MKEDLESVLSQADPENKGAITFKDFMKVMADKLVEKEEDDELSAAYRLLDPKGSGQVTGPLIKQTAQEKGLPLTDVDISEMMEVADTDGKGFVTLNDFLRIMKSA